MSKNGPTGNHEGPLVAVVGEKQELPAHNVRLDSPPLGLSELVTSVATVGMLVVMSAGLVVTLHTSWNRGELSSRPRPLVTAKLHTLQVPRWHGGKLVVWNKGSEPLQQVSIRWCFGSRDCQAPKVNFVGIDFPGRQPAKVPFCSIIGYNHLSGVRIDVPLSTSPGDNPGLLEKIAGGNASWEGIRNLSMDMTVDSLPGKSVLTIVVQVLDGQILPNSGTSPIVVGYEDPGGKSQCDVDIAQDPEQQAISECELFPD